ncbi:hypothetical protein INT47_011249 [Mucor saturninus]|uniref:Uncharacterized protein n=1 Tax=Mucor saturninus TaxID=64648 RepID=A0A8H7RM57_9FUNG|nr:hypothetical protein INT47_011249 [Mucor saturninus]
MASIVEKKYDYDKEVDELSTESSSASKEEAGSIGVFDFYIWTIIPAIGILFCFIHTEQERFWKWTGETISDAQSLQSKVVVSVISTVIGGCVVATLMKAIASVSYTMIRYQGANFSHLVAIIGGHSPGQIPMLVAGKRWFSIILIILILIVSAVTKQLAVVSMGVDRISLDIGSSNYAIRNYSTCASTNATDSIGGMFPVLALDAFNSLRNPNTTFTNEIYDRSIPNALLGQSIFERVLPYANVSCKLVKYKEGFSRFNPTLGTIPSSINKKYPSPWAATLSIPYHDDYGMSDIPTNSVNCSIYLGYATALTSCNNTYCDTKKITNIIRYEDDVYNGGLPILFKYMFEAVQRSGSMYRNVLMTWISGGGINDVYRSDRFIDGESLETITSRLENMGTVAARVLCDYNNEDMTEHYDVSYTTFQSRILHNCYIYHVLWKWPFWVLAGCIFILWLASMVAMRITPESRVISVEWLLSQYVTKDRLGYLSGGQLVKAHEGSIFQVVDLKADAEIGNIAISDARYHKYEANINVVHGRKYQ